MGTVRGGFAFIDLETGAVEPIAMPEGQVLQVIQLNYPPLYVVVPEIVYLMATFSLKRLTLLLSF